MPLLVTFRGFRRVYGCHTLNLSAYGETRIAPDTASISLGVMTEGKTAAEALSANATRMNAVMASLKKAVGELEVRTLLNGEYDEREAVISIRSGAGGVDAADFAEMLMRMYLRWADRHGYPTEILDTSYAEEAGLNAVSTEEE